MAGLFGINYLSAKYVVSLSNAWRPERTKIMSAAQSVVGLVKKKSISVATSAI